MISSNRESVYLKIFLVTGNSTSPGCGPLHSILMYFLRDKQVCQRLLHLSQIMFLTEANLTLECDLSKGNKFPMDFFYIDFNFFIKGFCIFWHRLIRQQALVNLVCFLNSNEMLFWCQYDHPWQHAGINQDQISSTGHTISPQFFVLKLIFVSSIMI